MGTVLSGSSEPERWANTCAATWPVPDGTRSRPSTWMPNRSKDWQETGSSRPRTQRGLASRSDVVVLSLPGGPEVEQVAEDILLPAARPGWIVIDMSTTPVGLTRAVAGPSRRTAARFLDAPVARTQQAAVDGTLSIMVGAMPAISSRSGAFSTAWAPTSPTAAVSGPARSPRSSTTWWSSRNGVAIAEALTIGERLGMEPAVLLDVIHSSSGASFVGQNHAVKAMVPDRFPLRQFPARYALKDLSYALMLAGDGGYGRLVRNSPANCCNRRSTWVAGMSTGRRSSRPCDQAPSDRARPRRPGCLGSAGMAGCRDRRGAGAAAHRNRGRTSP